MANLVYNRGFYLAGQGRITTGAAYYAMLVTTAYTAALTHNTVDDGTTSDPLSYEINTSGYARQAVAISAYEEDDTNNFAFLNATDTTYESLAAGATIGAAVVYIYSTSGGTTSDTGQELVAYYSVTATPTNGGNVTIQWASSSDGGFLKIGSTS